MSEEKIKAILKLIHDNFPNASDITLDMLKFKIKCLAIDSKQEGWQEGFVKGVETGQITSAIDNHRGKS